jgi:patatin-like phospholipase/acyl hydrolase
LAYRILSIDGGGLRGIIPLAVLQRLDSACPGWRASVHMYAGTSTGGLIALGLARGLSPADLMAVYIHQGPKIFSHKLLGTLSSLGDLIGPKYGGRGREDVCREVLGESKLGDFKDKHVVITSFALDGTVGTARRWKAKIFHNMPTRDGSGDEDELAYKVGMRTSAAPTYFPSYDGFIDGGVFANNPSMCALAQTQDDRLATPIPLHEISMLSLGTGFNPIYVARREARWGVLQWAPRMVDLMMDGVNEVADFQVRQMLRDGSHVRVSKPLHKAIRMDDGSQTALLVEEGNSVDLSEAIAFLNNGWSTLGPPEVGAVA